MPKPREAVVNEFNALVNMSGPELEKWLDNPKSRQAGTGVGLQSARRIIEILSKNPKMDPEKYEDDDIGHMGKVVG
jgi:hypothetical protein